MKHYRRRCVQTHTVHVTNRSSAGIWSRCDKTQRYRLKINILKFENTSDDGARRYNTIIIYTIVFLFQRRLSRRATAGAFRQMTIRNYFLDGACYLFCYYLLYLPKRRSYIRGRSDDKNNTRIL